MGKEFRHALHNRFLILFGICKDQTPFHSALSESTCIVTSLGASSALRNWYPDLLLYTPLCVKGQKRLSSQAMDSLSIRSSIFTSAKVSQIGDRTCGACCLGSQLLPHMPTDFPLAILHLQPLCNTSLPCKILLQAYDPPLEFLASMIEHLGKTKP